MNIISMLLLAFVAVLSLVYAGPVAIPNEDVKSLTRGPGQPFVNTRSLHSGGFLARDNKTSVHGLPTSLASPTVSKKHGMLTITEESTTITTMITGRPSGVDRKSWSEQDPDCTEWTDWTDWNSGTSTITEDSPVTVDTTVLPTAVTKRADLTINADMPPPKETTKHQVSAATVEEETTDFTVINYSTTYATTVTNEVISTPFPHFPSPFPLQPVETKTLTLMIPERSTTVEWTFTEVLPVLPTTFQTSMKPIASVAGRDEDKKHTTKHYTTTITISNTMRKRSIVPKWHPTPAFVTETMPNPYVPQPSSGWQTMHPTITFAHSGSSHNTGIIPTPYPDPADAQGYKRGIIPEITCLTCLDETVTEVCQKTTIAAVDGAQVTEVICVVEQ